MGRSPMTHSFSRFAVALVAAALVGFAFMPGEASARMGGMGGFHGGMGGFHGGFRGSPVALHAAPAFRSGFVSPQFRTPLIHRSVIVNRPFFVNRFHRFHRFHRFAFVGAPFFAASVAGVDDCLAPRRVWTSWGWRIRWINICYDYGYGY